MTGESENLYGPVEKAYRAWVGEMVDLSPRHSTIAEQIFRLASIVDNEEGGSAASAASRELRQLSELVRDIPTTTRRPDDESKPADVVDIAIKRAERRGEQMPTFVAVPDQNCHKYCEYSKTGRHSVRCPSRTGKAT